MNYQSMISPADLQKFQAIRQRQQTHPGSAIGGSGTTGLNPGDAQGWSRLQNENIWAENQIRGEPLAVEQAELDEIHRNPFNAQEDYRGSSALEGLRGAGIARYQPGVVDGPFATRNRFSR